MYPHKEIESKWQSYWHDNQTFACPNPPKRTVLILHGWGGNEYENWFPWLRDELINRGFDVLIPNLSSTDSPKLSEQLNDLKKLKHLLDDKSIIIGHSLGAKLACHFLAEDDIKVGKLFLVAPSFEGQTYSSPEIQTALKEYNDTPCSLEAVSSTVRVFLSDDDPYIQPNSAKQYYSRLPNVTFREFQGMGHFNAQSKIDQFPELLGEIIDEVPKKFYALDMFPYPSGAGLHVGHPKGYTATDIIARYRHAKGCHVLHPMGWDAFGLPAENYAIKTGTHPSITTDENVDKFRTQLQKFGFSFDWNREVNTTDPQYFKWTQWIFLKLFEAGLAYESDKPINFCPSCKTGLANEEVVDGKCERCGTPVEKKAIRQWILAITKFADRLLADIERLDWPEGIKEMQRNWIGKSEGCQFTMRSEERSDELKKEILLEVFTTRIDTVYGMTYAVIAPDHPQVLDFISTKYTKECEDYIKKSLNVSDLERTKVDKEKTGVFTGSYVINPYNGEKVPVWIADYVLGHYGTGAVMAVPAHDERDFAFAQKYGLPIKQSIAPYFTDTTGEGAPRKDKEDVEREHLLIVLKHHTKNAYCCLDWHKTTWKSFISGGLDGEDIETAGRREIKEETGYTNVRFIRAIGKQKQYYYASHKDINRVGFVEAVLFELIDESQDTVDPDELAKHTPVWIDAENMMNFLNIDTNIFVWKKLVSDFAFVEDGMLVNSLEYEWMPSAEARKVLTEKAEKECFGKKVTNYKLRDWIFSRQRYWGEPIPIIHIKDEDIDLASGCALTPTLSQEEREYTATPATDTTLPQSERKSVSNSISNLSLSKKEKNSTSTIYHRENFLQGTIELARQLRREETSTEKLFWLIVKDRGLDGLKFRRQFPIGRFVADFYCHELSIVIELDGEIHEQQKKRDIGRDAYIKKQGLTVLRFSNDDIWNNFETVADAILKIKGEQLDSSLPMEEGQNDGNLSGPSPFGRGQGEGNFSIREKSVITLKFRDPTVVDLITSGKKTIETRALNPEEPERYFENYRAGDCLIFHDIERDMRYLVKITKTHLWKNLNALYESMVQYPDEAFHKTIFAQEQILPEKVLTDIYAGLAPGYADKINQNGLIGFEFEIVGKLTRGITDWLLADWDLPLKLPDVEKYEPTGDGRSPLALITDWVDVRLGNNLIGQRESNTMPQWAGSCWYYLRYMDPENSEALVDPQIVKYWGEVDSYIGGAEHAVLHLLYARFWHKFLYDIGVVPTDEPFYRLRNVGLILGPDGNKMSKSRGNVINPDDVISEYGADTLRLYEMSMADFSDVAPWNTKAIIGNYRMLDKIWRIFTADEIVPSDYASDDLKAMKTMHKTIKKVGEDIENMKFNTAISSINIMINEGVPRDSEMAIEWKSVLARLLHPFAPHMAEECWTILKDKIQNTKYKVDGTGALESTLCTLYSVFCTSIFLAPWPEYNHAMTVDDEVNIAIQINGKLRGTYIFSRGVTAEEVRLTVEEKPEIAKWLEGQTVVKEVYIPNKILNLVVSS